MPTTAPQLRDRLRVDLHEIRHTLDLYAHVFRRPLPFIEDEAVAMEMAGRLHEAHRLVSEALEMAGRTIEVPQALSMPSRQGAHLRRWVAGRRAR